MAERLPEVRSTFTGEFCGTIRPEGAEDVP